MLRAATLALLFAISCAQCPCGQVCMYIYTNNMRLSTKGTEQKKWRRCAPVHTPVACQVALRGHRLPARRVTHLARPFALPRPPPAQRGGVWFPEEVVGGQHSLR